MAQKLQGKRAWGASLFAKGPSRLLRPVHPELLLFPTVKYTLSCRPLRCVPFLPRARLLATPAFPSDPGRMSRQGDLCPETEDGVPPGPRAGLRLRPAPCPPICTFVSAPPPQTCLRVSIPATAGTERTQHVCDTNADFSAITSRTQQVLSRARGKRLFNDSRWRGAAFRTWAEFSRGNRVLGFLCHGEAQHVTLQVGGVNAHLPFGGSSSLVLGWEAQPYQFQSPAQVHQPSLPSSCHRTVGDASRLCYACASDEATPGAGAQR